METTLIMLLVKFLRLQLYYTSQRFFPTKHSWRPLYYSLVSFFFSFLETKRENLKWASPCPRAEIRESGQRKEPIRLLKSFPCPLGKVEQFICVLTGFLHGLNSGYILSKRSNFIWKTMTSSNKLIIVYSFLFVIHGITTSGKNLDFEHIDIQRDNTVALGKKIVRVSEWGSFKIKCFFHTYDVNPNSCVDLSCPVFSTAFILANIFESNIVDG